MTDPKPTMADPTPIAFALFAFALTVYGVRFVAVDSTTLHGPTSDALNLALLAAGIGQTLGGVLAIIRGIAYRGWVTTVFGVWLIGFYFLLIHEDEAAAHDPGIITEGADGSPLPESVTAALQHANVTAWHAESVAWYVLLLIIPVVILAVPAFLHRNIPFMVAFVAIAVVLVLLGTGFHDVYSTVTDVTRGKATEPDLSTAVNLLKTSAYFAFIGAASIYFVLAKEIVQLTRVAHE